MKERYKMIGQRTDKEVCERILKYADLGDLRQAMKIENEMTKLIDFSKDSSFNYCRLITGIYLYGIEEGKRADRERRAHKA